MPTVFWDSEDNRYKITVTRAGYLDTATSYLHTTQKNKCSVILLHDNACPKTAAHTTTILQIWNWRLLDHPACIPVLGSSDYHLFGPLQEAMRVLQSPDNEMAAVHNLPCIQPKPFILKTL